MYNDYIYLCLQQLPWTSHKLSLHQCKRLEMETLVSVLEAEKNLEDMREKLAQLRRHHYSVAGEIEGEANM